MSVPSITLGRSGVTVPRIGVGTNRWATSLDAERLRSTFVAAIDAGAGFFDTAEAYGAGSSESALGIAAAGATSGVIASKFAPYPTRWRAAQLYAALDRSLQRLGRSQLDLYYLHVPYSLRGMNYWLEAMADAVHGGRVRAVGISNAGAALMHRAAATLERHGVPLAANQVQYNLSHRDPERNGVLTASAELDVALVAYRPLAGGSSAKADEPSPLTQTLTEVAAAHDTTHAHVALAWLLQRDERVIVIPGATRAAHVIDNSQAGALALSEKEFDAIDAASSRS